MELHAGEQIGNDWEATLTREQARLSLPTIRTSDAQKNRGTISQPRAAYVVEYARLPASVLGIFSGCATNVFPSVARFTRSMKFTLLPRFCFSFFIFPSRVSSPLQPSGNIRPEYPGLSRL